MRQKFATLLVKIKRYNPKANLALLKKAYRFARLAHKGQKRLSGEAFVNHPLAVAQTLTDWRLDTGSLVAALLHDTIEDAGIPLLEIKKRFGEEIALLVGGVTKIGEIKLRGRHQEVFVENLRKMIVVMAKDLRVVLIKLADRYHNLQTLWVLPKEKQERICRETIEIYAPLAERLGIGEMKGNLEDLAFPYLYSQEYHWLKKFTAAAYRRVDKDLLSVKNKLFLQLAKEGIKAKIHARGKHFYSLYQKLIRPEINRDLSKIHDLVALRVIVKTVEECYVALGMVHQLYKPVPSVGVSDFIAQPKPNGYRSIHTKVFGPKGRVIEIQIRTEEMHQQAENGIAAHWYYSQKKSSGTKGVQLEAGFFAPTEKMAWIKELVKWQKEITDSKEFIESLKFDALKHRNFIFSPKGDVYDLPAGATPIDFAYGVHTQLGDSCAGARVDGRLVPLSYQLKSGQMVEIITSKIKKQPSQDWLNFVVTRTARREISKHFRS